MTRPLQIADLFCGAGGLSEAARRACKELQRPHRLVCVNHWHIAIATHERMHPEAKHYCSDVALVRPIEAVPAGYLDLLMAAPSCIYHSRARGGRPTSDQQRMDPWHIVPWVTDLSVRRGLVENVPEFLKWGPVDPRTGRPIKSREGEYFREWVATLERLGNRFEHRLLNCADYGDATTRVRFFGQFRRLRGRSVQIAWPSPSHGDSAAGEQLFAKPWRGAREIINWSHRGRSIFGRKTPLAPTTIRRIYTGAVKLRWPEPFIVVLRQHMAARSIEDPLPAITAGGTHLGLVEPMLIRSDIHGAKKLRARTLNQPIQTILGNGGIGLVEPFVLAQGEGGVARAVSSPLPALPTGCAHALIAPYYGQGSGTTCKSVKHPLDAITTKARFGMVMPITHSGGGNRARDLHRPIPTVTTAKRGELAFITAAFGERDGQMPRVQDLDRPVPTICAEGGAGYLVEPEGDGLVYDIHYRMLQPDELSAATSLSDADEGVVYDFVGNKEQVHRQIGNAVPGRTGKALVVAAFHDLAND